MRVVVVGAGVVGLAVSRALLRRGCGVTCLEATVPMAARSAGSTHLFRIAHADPEQARLAVRSEWWWREWTAEYSSLFVRRREDRLAPYRRRRGPHLIYRHELVVSGPDLERWDRAMSMADSVDGPHPERLPPIAPPPTQGYNDSFSGLRDRRACVIDGAATSRYLRSVVGSNLRIERVTRIEPAADSVTVWTDAGRYDADHVVIAAGEGTRVLARQAGIGIPGALDHRVRFTFALRYREDLPRNWLDHRQTWQAGRPGVLFDQHLSGDKDRWAITVTFTKGLPWQVDRDVAITRSLEAARGYLRENMRGVGREPLEIVHGSVIAGIGEEVYRRRSGCVTAIWGNELFMHAPAIGHEVAADLCHDTDRAVPIA
ncbi:FAD-dependent oxidoreductase [Actinophytocola sp.]|uniref:FAD-dependent oxidoreductase n=1 Tax=Actinophytocola sp. TaxID=1872138 RepID=UPI002D810D2D|nr:FAD-dependent oxidoreductase [Actinophytocola sp.]HET9139546.1 FAD-dependent oxidoreductase [Actinophytocola sp.]